MKIVKRLWIFFLKYSRNLCKFQSHCASLAITEVQSSLQIFSAFYTNLTRKKAALLCRQVSESKALHSPTTFAAAVNQLLQLLNVCVSKNGINNTSSSHFSLAFRCRIQTAPGSNPSSRTSLALSVLYKRKTNRVLDRPTCHRAF